MKKISIISICLLIFVVAISCASAVDYDADATNDATIDNMTNIEEANDIDLNISSDESPALDIEPLKNDVPNSSSIKKDTPVLVIHKPKLYKVCLDNIPGTEQPVFNKVLVSFDLLGPILLLLSG